MQPVVIVIIGMSPLPGGRWHCVIPCAMWVPVVVWQPCELLYTCYLLLQMLHALVYVSWSQVWAVLRQLNWLRCRPQGPIEPCIGWEPTFLQGMVHFGGSLLGIPRLACLQSIISSLFAQWQEQCSLGLPFYFSKLFCCPKKSQITFWVFIVMLSCLSDIRQQ